MKKLIVTLMLALVSVILMGEPVVSTYRMGGDEYEVRATRDGTFLMSVMGEATYAQSPMMMVYPGTRNVLISQMTTIKTKYREWVGIAKKNNVTSNVTVIESFNVSAAFVWVFGDEYHFSGLISPVELSALFVINGSDMAVCIIIPKQVSMENEYVTWDPRMVVMLTSEEEIQRFLDSMDPKHVSDTYEEIDKNSNLFK